MDEGTYWARVQRVAQMMDIRTAFVTDTQLTSAVDLVNRSANGDTSIPLPELAQARKIKDAIVHPDTGDKIFAPLRISFIVPCNLILDTLMISAQGRFQHIGAQWLNQTYNSLHYYANRNASNAESTNEILGAYAGATASSVGAALGLNGLCDRMPPGSKWAPIARRFIPFCAVAAADVLNLGITRRNEFLEGIRVYDPVTGEEMGRSQSAGLWAVSACIGGRVAAAAPILIIPPLIIHRLEQNPTFMRNTWLKTPALMAMIGVGIQVFVPLFFGMFKQQATADVYTLEAHFHDMRNSEGSVVERVRYNKGI